MAHLASQGRTAGLPLAGAVASAWRTLTAPVRDYLSREATYRELISLDERMLADIGLHRSDIEAVASGARAGRR